MRHTKLDTPHDRPARLLKALPQSKTLKEAMLSAGYAASTAAKDPSRTIRTAMNSVAARSLQGDGEAERLLALTGISRSKLWERLRYIALESPSHATSLQALQPLLRAHAYNIEPKDEAKNVPPVSVTVIENTPQRTAIEAVDVTVNENVTDIAPLSHEDAKRDTN